VAVALILLRDDGEYIVPCRVPPHLPTRPPQYPTRTANPWRHTSNAKTTNTAQTTHHDAVKSTTTNISLDFSINSAHSPSDSTNFTMIIAISV
jgi:hypothetical protein